MENFSKANVYMLLKVHLVYAHIGWKDNKSEEQEKHFHQSDVPLEATYKRKKIKRS